MSLLSRLFGWGRKKNNSKDDAQSRVEEFMSLIGIYNQASIVAHIGITNLKMVPEFAAYKRAMRIPTTGGKLGLAEKAQIKKMMIADYKMSELFFKEIDASIRKNCKNIRDVQNYFFAFGNFSNDLLTFVYTQSQWKIQGSMLIKKLLRSTVKSSVDNMMTKITWKDSSATNSAFKLRATAATLKYSNEWMTELVYQILLRSKK